MFEKVFTVPYDRGNTVRMAGRSEDTLAGRINEPKRRGLERRKNIFTSDVLDSCQLPRPGSTIWSMPDLEVVDVRDVFAHRGHKW